MSVKVQTLVWESRLYNGTRLNILLALADFADDDGSNVFPSVARVAWKCRLGRRQTQEHLRALEADEVLHLVARAGGGRGRARNYTINVGKLAGLAARLHEPPADVSCETKGAEGRTLLDENGAGDRTLSPQDDTPDCTLSPEKGAGDRTLSSVKGAEATAPNPSLSTDRPREADDAAPAAPLAVDFVVPEEWRAWARANFFCDDLEAEAANFVDHCSSSDERRSDWFGRWRLWIRNGRRNTARRDDAIEAERPSAPPLDPEWQAVRDAIQAECAGRDFSTWIKPIVFVERSGGRVVLSVATEYARGWVTGHFGELLHAAWQGAVGGVTIETVDVVVGDRAPGGGSGEPN